MRRGFKIFLIIVASGIVLGAATVYYVFNKPHRNIEDATPSFFMTAKNLYNEFNTNEKAANLKYGDKIIQVSGKIVEISGKGYNQTIVLNDELKAVSCALDSLAIVKDKNIISSLTTGDSITLKGKCDGLDMIMGVVLTRCFFVEKK